MYNIYFTYTVHTYAHKPYITYTHTPFHIPYTYITISYMTYTHTLYIINTMYTIYNIVGRPTRENPY